MDLGLSEEQMVMQTMIRKFIEKEVKPGALKRDENFDSRLPVEERYPWDLMKKASALGLRTLGVPKKYGGAHEAFNMVTQVLLAEEIGKGSDAFIHSLILQWKNCHYLSVNLNEEQQDEFFPQFVKDDTYLIASAVTEPASSTDIHIPYDEPGTMQTYAYRDGSEYVINGTKHFVSSVAFAKLFLVHARTDKNKPISQAMSVFLVPLRTPGLSVGHIDDMLGHRLGGNAELLIENCRIPARYRIGEEGQMFLKRMSGWRVSLLTVQAAAVGEMQACYDETLEYAKTRLQGGKPIVNHINVGTRLVEMRTWIEAARAIIQKAACLWETQGKEDPVMIYGINAYVKELRIKVMENAIEIWAGYGIQRESPIQMYIRNAWMHHGGGTPTVNRIKAMKLL